ncbi:MAG TPA: AI-2E family transporter [Acidimicrobiia bacterium]|nr:AI-2E family transporter [Acidimicrobiia bacterium]
MTERRTDGLRRLGIAAWSLLGTILLLGLIGWILLRFWIIIPPVLLAIAIVYVLNPFVTALAERGVARWMGSCLSYLVLAGLLTALGFLVIPGISEQAGDMARDFPVIYDDVVDELESLIARVGIDASLPDYEQLTDEGAGGFLGNRFDRITDFAFGVLEALFLLFLAPVVAFYALLDLPRTHGYMMDLVPERHRAEMSHVGRQLGRAVGGFMRGQLLVALIVGTLTSFGLWLIGLPFWLLIGMISGFLNIVPLIGPWIGGALGVLVAIGTRDPQTALWAGLVAVIVQQIDNNFVSPAVLRATVRLHPTTIILGLVAGASLGGFWGILLAVPAMAVIKIIAGHLWRTRVLGQSWDEAAEALIDDNPTGELFLSRPRRDGGGFEPPPEISEGERGGGPPPA